MFARLLSVLSSCDFIHVICDFLTAGVLVGSILRIYPRLGESRKFDYSEVNYSFVIMPKKQIIYYAMEA